MSIAITEDHRTLAATVSDFLAKHQSRAAARALLEADEEPNAAFYKEAADLGWLGLHVPEELGGSGLRPGGGRGRRRGARSGAWPRARSSRR